MPYGFRIVMSLCLTLVTVIAAATAVTPVFAQTQVAQGSSKAAKKPRTNEKMAARPTTTGKVLVRVDGLVVTQEDLDRMLLSRGVPEAARKEAAPQFLEQLIDNRLIQQFLAQRKVEANKEDVEEQVTQLRRLIEREDGSKRTLADFGYTPQSLREEVALPLAWKNYLSRSVTEKQIADYFEQHRQELDDTRVRASHILLKVSTAQESPELEAVQAKLAGIREEILKETLTFEDAARKYSAAPSREQGGDVGFFPWEGVMPEAFSKVAFALEPGKISPPFKTLFGVHICLVTDRKPGELSLEDARADVIGKLSQEMWRKTVAELRGKATIARSVSQQ